MTATSAPAKGAPSPFLPGTSIQYAWDSTSLGWLKTCPRLYQYSMILGYRAKHGSQVHLFFGQLYHGGLELYDRLKAEGELDHEKNLRTVVLWLLTETWADGAPMPFEHNLKTRENLVRTVVWYLEQFRNDAAETVILANGKPAVELSFKLELDYTPAHSPQPYLLSGHLDRVVTFAGSHYVMDRKTASSTIGSYYFDGYSPDNQMSLYTFAAQVIYSAPVKGVIIDAAQIAVGFSRFERGFTHRTPDQIEEWLHETKAWLRLAEGFAVAGHWPMNDKSCHQYGGCTFRKVCAKSPQVRQTFLDSDYAIQPWNPLVPR